VGILNGHADTALAHPCVARQPILDRHARVMGYELLFRRSHSVQSCDAPNDEASARVIVDAVLSIGLETLTMGKRAFVNVSRGMLKRGVASLLPRDQVVIELLEDVIADPDTLEACRALKTAGYSIALDDYAGDPVVAPLVPLADYVKIDFRALATPAARALLIASLRPATPHLLAEKVETPEEYAQATAEGFACFQGYFFGRPAANPVKRIAARHMAYATLLVKLNKPDISVSELEDIVKQDVSLSYRVLRALNSAANPLRVEISSIRQAIILLGRDTIKRWASLWVIASMNENAHPELVASSIIRARCCEMVDTRLHRDSGSGFLLGMCSLLDVILEQPMASVLSSLPVDAAIKAALLGETNERRALLDCVIAYERGEWDRFDALAAHAGTNADVLREAYHEALRWTRQLTVAA
jgi:EAL and modified HD-GYP domain-containing signal transduction protein